MQQRPIKFRAWTGTSYEYRVVIGALGAFYVEGLDPKDSASMSSFNTIYSEGTPIEQFTGLLDKNGKEIYEGDIFVIDDEQLVPVTDEGAGPVEDLNHLAPVIFRDGAFGLDIRERADIWEKGFTPFTAIKDHVGLTIAEYEVIGNIHENPELIEPGAKQQEA